MAQCKLKWCIILALAKIKYVCIHVYTRHINLNISIYLLFQESCIFRIILFRHCIFHSIELQYILKDWVRIFPTSKMVTSDAQMHWTPKLNRHLRLIYARMQSWELFFLYSKSTLFVCLNVYSRRCIDLNNQI